MTHAHRLLVPCLIATFVAATTPAEARNRHPRPAATPPPRTASAPPPGSQPVWNRPAPLAPRPRPAAAPLPRPTAAAPLPGPAALAMSAAHRGIAQRGNRVVRAIGKAVVVAGLVLAVLGLGNGASHWIGSNRAETSATSISQRAKDEHRPMTRVEKRQYDVLMNDARRLGARKGSGLAFGGLGVVVTVMGGIAAVSTVPTSRRKADD